MERSEGLDFDTVKGVRKPRTFASRKPRTLSSHTFRSYYDHDRLSRLTTSPSDMRPSCNGSSIVNLSRLSNDENEHEMEPGRSGETFKRKHDMDDFGNQTGSSKAVPFKGNHKPSSNLRCNEGVLAPAKTRGSDWTSHPKIDDFDRIMDEHVEKGKRFSGRSIGGQYLRHSKVTDERKSSGVINGLQNEAVEDDLSEADSKLAHLEGASFQENRPTKVKLKLRGVTHTISASHSESSKDTKLRVPSETSASKTHPPDVRRRQKLILQGNTDDECDHPLTAVKHCFTLSKSRTDRHSMMEDPRNKTSNGSTYRKSKGNDVVDVAAFQPVRKSTRVPKRRVLDGQNSDDENENDNEVPYHKNRGFKRRNADSAYAEDFEDIGNLDLELDLKSQKRRREDLVGFSVNEKREVSLTARQRALQSIREADPGAGAKLFEFPDELPHTGQKRIKEKIPDLEQQLKKAEAAQRRRMQVEKASKEIQAEAIRKILGHDRNKETLQDKLRRKRTEMAQEKAAASMVLGSNTVRWVLGPTGTIVSFSEDAGLPTIFNSTTCRYPPPREKCAGPSCTNSYKYRDSKSNLPLCSLQCYRVINGRMQPVTSC
ncbi:uncharacterized protein LOC143884485 [Tasmannia lanceolata]|uniref:uncharacterized protein LOC143884485 n=1 Tax=Tasmannia lanceolata TaxID=3420 RepID=UPI0040636C3B